MAQPETAYTRHYSIRVSALREYMRVKGDALNAKGMMLLARAIRAMERERGPVTPLRDVLREVVR